MCKFIRSFGPPDRWNLSTDVRGNLLQERTFGDVRGLVGMGSYREVTVAHKTQTL